MFVLSGNWTEAAQAQPNILFILTDDQTGAGFSSARNPLPGLKTPHLDQLGRDGVVFDRCYAETPICACSRASILTGQYMRTNGIRDFDRPLDPAQMALTYPALLKRANYFTGFLGKFGVGSQTDRDLKPPSLWFDDWHVWHDQGDYFPKDDPRSGTSTKSCSTRPPVFSSGPPRMGDHFASPSARRHLMIHGRNMKRNTLPTMRTRFLRR